MKTRVEQIIQRLSQNRILLILFWTILFLLTALLFGLAYTQSPLYEGNQNTKFLHGLALAGRGYLIEDWVANTADPLPVFSLLVNLTVRLNERLFYVYYILLFGVYCWSLIGIANEIYPTNKTWARRLAIFALLLVFHSRWLIKLFERTYTVNLRLIQYGLADQYLLGEEFQNSTMGVLLLLSIYLFLRRKYLWSVLLIGVAAIFHSAYLYTGGLMIAAYCGIILWENITSQPAGERWQPKILWKSVRQPFLLGLVALAFAVPLVLYNQLALPSTDPESARQALRILVQERIPHHTQPAVFMDQWAYLQVALMVVGVILSRGTRLTTVMLTLFLGGAIGSTVQVLTGSDSLGLLGPWRVSVLLVPISTVLVFAFGLFILLDALRLGRLPYQWVLVPLALYYIYIAVGLGIEDQQKLGEGARAKRVAVLMAQANRTSGSGDVFLIPPLEGEFNDFRIATGLPILANWKTHPYKDDEVLEWYHRVELANQFYNTAFEEKCGVLESILEEYPEITRVVNLGKEVVLPCDFLREDFRYLRYTLYSVEK